MLRKRPGWRQQREQEQEQLQTSKLIHCDSAPTATSIGNGGGSSNSAAKVIRTVRRMGRGTETMAKAAIVIILLFLLTRMTAFISSFISNNFLGTRNKGTIGMINTYANHPPSQLLVDKEKYNESSLQRWAECGCYVNENGGGRIAYLVTLHNQRTLEDSLTLMKTISTPKNIILIHIDAKVNMEEYMESELYDFINARNENGDGCQACGANVLVESKFDLQWGEWSMNYPTHWAMNELITNPKFIKQWDVFINVSADTMPVYTPDILSNLFDPDNDRGLYNVNFVTSHSCLTGLYPTHWKKFPHWNKRAYYASDGPYIISYVDRISLGVKDTKINEDEYTNEEIKLESKTDNVDIYFGSQWMMLSPTFVEYIATSLSRHDSFPSRLKEEFIRRKVKMTDETFIPTVLMHHSSFRHTLPHVVEHEHDKDNDEDSTSSHNRGDDGRTTPSIAGGVVQYTNIRSIRYERMDEDKPNVLGNVISNQRYDVPKSLRNAGKVDIPKVWGPYYLGVYDLGDIMDSGALFIRKVNKDVDPNIVQIFPVSDRDQVPSIYWPSEIEVSKKVDWESWREMYARKKKAKRK